MPGHYDDKKKKKKSLFSDSRIKALGTAKFPPSKPTAPKPPKAPKPKPPKASKPTAPKPPSKPKSAQPRTLPSPKPKHPTMGMDYLEWVKREKKGKGKDAAYGPNLLSEAVRKKYKKKKK